MIKQNNAMKAGIGYTVGNFLVKGINFIVLPFFSRIMTTDEFGVYNVFLSYDAVLSVLLGMALHTSVKKAHYKFRDTDAYVSSVSLVYILNACCFLIIALMGGERLAATMGLSSAVVLLLIPFGFGGAIIQLYNERISLDYSYRKYLIVALCSSLGNVLLSIVLMFTAFYSRRDMGRILGTAGTSFLIAAAILIGMYRKALPRWNRQYWKFGILYSLPIIPHGISQVLLAHCDRIMISRMVSRSAAGIYSLAGNLKLALTVFSTSIAVSWSTWFFAQMDQGEYGRIQKNAGLLARMFLIMTIGLMAVSPEMILLIGGPAYLEGKYVAVPMIMDAFILFLYNLIIPGEYYYEKTGFIMAGTMAAAVINLVTNYIFIGLFGFAAAAYTTLFSYICYLILHCLIAGRLVHFDVLEKKWILLAGLTAAAAGALDLLMSDNLPVRLGTAAVLAVVLSPPLVRWFMENRNE